MSHDCNFATELGKEFCHRFLEHAEAHQQSLLNKYTIVLGANHSNKLTNNTLDRAHIFSFASFNEYLANRDRRGFAHSISSSTPARFFACALNDDMSIRR